MIYALHSRVTVFIPDISVATTVTFADTILTMKKTNWVELVRKFSFGAITSPKIQGSTFLLNKTFPYPRDSLVLLRKRYPGHLYKDSYYTNMLNNNIIEADLNHHKNIPSN